MPTDEWYRLLARDLYGDVDIDEDAVVSRPYLQEKQHEDGAYVQAWVWVANHECPPDLDLTETSDED